MDKFFFVVPALLFLVVYKLFDIYYATAVLMASVTLLTLIEWLRTRQSNKVHLTSTILLIVLGTVTLLFRDPRFLVWKFSIFHWILAAYLLYTHFYSQTTGLQGFFSTMDKISGNTGDDEFNLDQIPEEKYRQGNLAAIIYFVMVGVINFAVWNMLGEAAWVNFKVFGIFGLNLAFGIALMGWLFYGLTSKNSDL